MQNEFDLIARYFSPLAKGEDGALFLSDDAAVITLTPGMQTVYTKDLLIAGVHFFAQDDPKMLAQKLLAVNGSDLAAMGAEPRGYLLGLALPKSIEETWVAAFADGLKAAMKQFGGALLGGDTTAHDGPLVLSLTAIGEIPEGKALLRSGAKSGDIVYVSGTIGDAAVGLRVLQGKLVCDAKAKDFLTGRYYLPTPRIALGIALRDIASAAADISDGLVADMGHIAETSAVSIAIEAEKVPLSEASGQLLAAGKVDIEALLTGGDDYELVFTVPAEKESKVQEISKQLELPLTRIGMVESGEGVRVVQNGQPLYFSKAGYQHF